MSTKSIAQHTEHEQQRALIGALLADVTALRAALVAVTAKLDADDGVTGTNYAATCNPPALTTVA